MRTDPTDTGGLFVGRRPGTAPLRFRSVPQRGSDSRRRLDRWLAHGLLAAMTLMCAMCWGPLPLLCLWIGSQIDYYSGSMMLGIVAAFMTLLGVLLGLLTLLSRLDRAWLLVRRAAGFDQRSGVLGRVFAASAVLGASGFGIWFLLIQGPGVGLVAGRSGL